MCLASARPNKEHEGWLRQTIMKIDIDKLSEEELVDLNHRIVERLRFLNQMRAHSADAGL